MELTKFFTNPEIEVIQQAMAFEINCQQVALDHCLENNYAENAKGHRNEIDLLELIMFIVDLYNPRFNSLQRCVLENLVPRAGNHALWAKLDLL